MGRVFRKGDWAPGLLVSRAFGDFSAKQVFVFVFGRVLRKGDLAAGMERVLRKGDGAAGLLVSRAFRRFAAKQVYPAHPSL